MALIRNAVGVLATSVVGIPLHLLTSIVLARFLSVEDRGVYGVAISIITIGSLVFELGWGPATIYRLKRLGLPPARIAGTSLWFCVVMGGIVCLGGAPLASFVNERFMSGAPSAVYTLALITIAIHFFWILFASMARGIDRFPLQNGGHVAMNLSRLLGTVIALVLLDGSVVAAVVAYLVSQLFGSLIVFVGVVRQTGVDPKLRRQDLIDTQRFGLQSFLARIGVRLHERIDVFMIAFLLDDPREIAYYAVAVAVIAQLKLIPEAISGALYPELAATPEEDTGVLAATVARHTLLWVLVTALLAGLSAPLLIPLVYGDPYTASVLPFLVLLPGTALFTRYRVLSNYFTSLNRQRVNVQTQVVTLVLNIGLNWFLIPRYGILGAALASLASYSAAAFWINVAFVADSGVPLRRTLLPGRGDWGAYRRRLEPALRRFGWGA
ncbi:MAG: oligosaccharide flippase family protein [Myxococcota bacterium]|nr:oligosaccharide flippase family protein [Myxococcota bacterium]